MTSATRPARRVIREPAASAGHARKVDQILIHLTPFAAGCEQLAIDAPARWLDFDRSTPRFAVRTMLERLQLGPADVSAQTSRAGTEVEIAAETPEGLGVVALIGPGLDLGDVQAALQALAADPAFTTPARPALKQREAR